jgi:hypothetical protein
MLRESVAMYPGLERKGYPKNLNGAVWDRHTGKMIARS